MTSPSLPSGLPCGRQIFFCFLTLLSLAFAQCPWPTRSDPDGSGAGSSLPDTAGDRSGGEGHYWGKLARVRSELRQFTDWLAANDARGYIGEVGWPGDEDEDAARWNEVGEAWYQDANAAGLWVTQWSAGEWWPPDYPLAVYFRPPGSAFVADAKAQAAVIERHSSTSLYSRGVACNGGEFGSVAGTTTRSEFSNANPGVYDRDWHYDGLQTLRYLASRGLGHVRLTFRWERLQPQLGGPLDDAERRRLQSFISDARTADLGVILSVSNYGAYMLYDPEDGEGIRRPIGSLEVRPEHFYDLWDRLSSVFGGQAGVLGYSLMSEPTGLPGENVPAQARLWEHITQQTVDRIRANGDATTILVPGYDWSAVATWNQNHPIGWISDPLRNFRYEAHHYFDSNRSGEYQDGWTDE